LKDKSYYIFIPIILLVLSLPSIGFSEVISSEGKYCGNYQGDLKNKKKIDMFREQVRKKAIYSGLLNTTNKLTYKTSNDCLDIVYNIIVQDLSVISHTENKRKICDTVRFSINTYILDNLLSLSMCNTISPSKWLVDIEEIISPLNYNGIINIGFVIQSYISNIKGMNCDLIEMEEENDLFEYLSAGINRYRYIDRKHISKVLEEHKLQMTGLTDSENINVGKILNLDIIVLRLIYNEMRITKVMRVDTGEVLLFKTYHTNQDEGWIYYGKNDGGEYYYDSNVLSLDNDIIRVWKKVIINKKSKLYNGYNELDNMTGLDEYNCKYRTVSSIIVYSRDKKGNILQEDKFDTREYRQVIPGTMDNIILNKICH